MQGGIYVGQTGVSGYRCAYKNDFLQMWTDETKIPRIVPQEYCITLNPLTKLIHARIRYIIPIPNIRYPELRKTIEMRGSRLGSCSRTAGGPFWTPRTSTSCFRYQCILAHASLQQNNLGIAALRQHWVENLRGMPHSSCSPTK